MSSVRIELITIELASWERYDRQPKIINGADHVHEFLESHRLGDIAVGVKVVGPENVSFSFGRREDDDRDTFELFVAFQVREQFTTVLLGEIKVHQNEIEMGRLVVRGRAAQHGERFQSISSHG